MKKDRSGEVLKLAKQAGVLRPRDLDIERVPRAYLSRLIEAGQLRKIGRGLYIPASGPLGEHQSIVEIAKRVPNGVICLLSALRFHELTTQAPCEVWIAINEKAWRPHLASRPVRFVRFSGRALREGVETHRIKGVTVHIYNPAKTVADCFKYRNKIGVDVALEALRECWRARRCTADELWHFAEVCRVQNVIRPYVEAIAA